MASEDDQSSEKWRSGDELDNSGECLVQAQYDPDGRDSLITTICAAIAEAKGTAISEMDDPPLYDSVDVEALGSILFGDRQGQYSAGNVEIVVFSHNDLKVRVGSSGEIQVCSLD